MSDMESEIQKSKARINEALNSEAPGQIVGTKQPSPTDRAWREWADPVLDFLEKLPDEIGIFFSDYKKPLLTLLLFVGGFVTVYITLAVLDAVNDIPLLSPIFELVGIGYTGWFVYRYLLQSSTRGELLAEFDKLKAQILGKNS
jgi:hypothetical protein